MKWNRVSVQLNCASDLTPRRNTYVPFISTSMYTYLSPPMLQRTLSSQRQKILELMFSNHFAHLTAIDQVVLIFEGTLKRKICILCTALGDNFNFVVNISQRLWHLKLTDAVIMTPLCAFPQKANLVGFIEGWKRATRQIVHWWQELANSIPYNTSDV